MGHGAKIAKSCASLLCEFLLELQCCRNQFPSCSFVNLNPVWLCFLVREMSVLRYYSIPILTPVEFIFTGVCQTTSNRKSEAIM